MSGRVAQSVLLLTAGLSAQVAPGSPAPRPHAAPVAAGGAAYSLAEAAWMKSAEADPGDEFGYSIAIDGDRMVVAARGEDGGSAGVDGDETDDGVPTSGAVFVFERTGSTWTQTAYLKPSNPDENDSFGFSVDVSGDVIVVGAIGEASLATGIDGTQGNDTLFSGAAYVFAYEDGAWSQQAYLKHSHTEFFDMFGNSVAVTHQGDDAIVVVGVPGDGSPATGVDGDASLGGASDSGAAFVFRRTGSTWAQDAFLKASNTGAADSFGFAVDADGDTIVVGAYFEGSGATGVDGSQRGGASTSGAAYVFRHDGAAWSQEAYLKASNTGSGDEFGRSVAVSGDTIVVGASKEDGSSAGVDGDQLSNDAPDSGAAYVFVRDAETWSQQAYLKASNPGSGDEMHRVAIDGDTAVVTAAYEYGTATGIDGPDDDGAALAGAAYVFVRSGSTWSPAAYVKPHNTAKDQRFGRSVAVSGSTIGVGSHKQSSAGTGVNPTDPGSASSSGAAYVFDTPGTWTDLGGGSTGAASTPLLAGTGPLFSEASTTIALSDAPGHTLFLVWFSLAPTPFAALGGTVHAFPFANQFLFASDAAGGFSATLAWPSFIPSGTEVWFQCIVQDASTPAGLTLSNGLRATCP